MKRFLQDFWLTALLIFIVNIGVGIILVFTDRSQVWRDFYEQKKIDVCFVGSSHSAFCFNPLIIDSLTNLKSFNLSSAAQTPKTAYFIINETIHRFKPRYIIQELFFLTFIPEDQFLNQMVPFPKIKNSELKFKMYVNHFSFIQKIKFFFPSYYYKNQIVNRMKSLFPNLENNNQTKITFYKGYYGFLNKTNSEELLAPNIFNAIFDLNSIDYEQFNYLSMTAELCKKNGVELIWVTAPIPKISLNKVSTYLKFHEKLSDLANSKSIPYYDYNIQSALKLNDTADFKDADHLNTQGGTIISTDISEKLLHFLTNRSINGDLKIERTH